MEALQIVETCAKAFGKTNLSHERVHGYSRKPDLGILSKERIPQNEEAAFMQMLL